jgi:hypothetical protein
MFISSPKEAIKGNFTASQRGLFWLSKLRSDGAWNSQAGGWTSEKAAKDTLS